MQLGIRVLTALVFMALLFSSGQALAQPGNPPQYGIGFPQRVQDLPRGALRSRLESLPPQALGKALQWLQGFSFPEADLQSLHIDDSALKCSRRKPGNEQEERLGHYLRNLHARNAYYLDVTRNRGVGSKHSYFKGEIVTKNSRLKRIFSRIFEGGKAERLLNYHADINVYRT